jgi:RimJ/RimL family protein N-acetyltransferase
MYAVYNYVFKQLGCSRISVTTRADNELVIGIAERLGFVREGYLRKFYGDADGVLLGLLKKDFIL